MKENRRWTRVYFSSKDAVAGELWVAEEWIVPARVLNISEGGLAMTLRVGSDFTINQGDRFRMKSLEGPHQVRILTAPAVLEVVWVAVSEGFEHMGLGCSFLYVVPPDKNRLRRFVEGFA
ncbi:PilZ domain-containing protein [Desulfobotulus sp.]|uniref:PilZ domain-containing protein n=1 Tax=Desulfobotulus sp. TaxID=1940337 RepID=UPI002A370CEA|nr:PilZ domain-containing protein [Desulfobotulus sp.]MDY0163172.1 PilZ domain-containing protein [Desulfobotulus sp.]